MTMRLEQAQEILGYRFKDVNVLKAALTHPSATEGQAGRHSYERLEFLGDSILGAIVAREAFSTYPQLDEGGLTRIKVSLVSGVSLSALAEELGIGQVIIFGQSEAGTGKRGLHSALENVYEAIVAAICLDGGYQSAHDFVARTLLPRMDISMAREPENPKSTLQEHLQEHRITPTYEIIETMGPPHDRSFVSRVLAAGIPLAQGFGHSKKEAEVEAAREALLHYDECLATVLHALGMDSAEAPEAASAVNVAETTKASDAPASQGEEASCTSSPSC